MRIIKAAKKLEECIVVCDNCKSVLALTTKDLENETNSYGYYCGVCGCKNHIKANNRNELFPWIMEDEENDRQVQSDNAMRVNTL